MHHTECKVSLLACSKTYPSPLPSVQVATFLITRKYVISQTCLEAVASILKMDIAVFSETCMPTQKPILNIESEQCCVMFLLGPSQFRINLQCSNYIELGLGKFILFVSYLQPVPVSAPSKAQVCGRSPARLSVRILLEAWTFVCCECCVLSGRGLCDELITRTEESYRL